MLAGFGIADITPPLGTPLAGHFNRRPAEGVHDPLHAVAAVIDDGENRVALVSCDLLCLTREVTQAARALIHQQVGIPPHSVLVAATHTHAGPEIRPERDPAGGKYIELLVEKIATAVVLAARSLTEVEILAAVGREDRISFNRRYRMRDGSVRTNPGVGNPDIIEPAGPIDPDVLAVWAMADGKPLGVVLNFACHLDVLGSSNRLISADAPHWVRQTISGAVGRSVPVVYLNGACGDINHIDVRRGPRGTFAHSRLMGRVLAGEALKILQQATEVGPAPVRAAAKDIEVRRRVLDPETVRWAERVLTDESTDKESWAYYRARRVLETAERKDEVEQAEVSVVRVGQVGFVGLPGEIFCEIGLEIKSKSPAAMTGIAELACHNLGYVPTERAFAEGGYEVESAAWQENLCTLLEQTAADLLAEVFED